jgi:hypothetical protein
VSELKTPQKVGELEESVRSDLALVKAAFVGGVGLLSGLEECLRVLPDTRGQLRNWRLQVEEICRQIDAEADAAAKKIGADAPPIESVVNTKHLAVVRAARQHDDGCPLRHFSYEVGSGMDIPSCTCEAA